MVSVEKDKSAQNIEFDFDAELVRAYQQLRKRTAGMLRSRDRGDDLANQTIVKAIENKHQFQPGTSMINWLSVIARNTNLSNYRREGKRGNREARAALPTVTRPNQIHALEYKQLTHAIEKLPTDQQSVLVHALLHEGKTQGWERDASKGNVLPQGTKSSRTRRARLALITQGH